MRRKTLNQITNNIIENEVLTETIKKSQLIAENGYDYQRLVYPMQGLLECDYEESLEEITFRYKTKGMKTFQAILQEDKEKKYQLLINFAKLFAVYWLYDISFAPDNLYYDDNYLIYVKKRDIYPKGVIPEEAYFFEQYCMFVCGVLGTKYSISQLQESGLGVVKDDKRLQQVFACESKEELELVLQRNKQEFLQKKSHEERLVSKIRYGMWRGIAVFSTIVMIGTGAYTVYNLQIAAPKQQALLEAAQAFIMNDYTECIDSAQTLEIDEMDTKTKYILAVAYANAESFQKEKIDKIIAKLSPSSNERELEYWIHLGRLEIEQAEKLALSLSDDQLLVYAYMKELDVLEGNLTMDGEEKKNRIDWLEQEIEKIGEKYRPQEEETN